MSSTLLACCCGGGPGSPCGALCPGNPNIFTQIGITITGLPAFSFTNFPFGPGTLCSITTATLFIPNGTYLLPNLCIPQSGGGAGCCFGSFYGPEQIGNPANPNGTTICTVCPTGLPGGALGAQSLQTGYIVVQRVSNGFRVSVAGSVDITRDPSCGPSTILHSIIGWNYLVDQFFQLSPLCNTGSVTRNFDYQSPGGGPLVPVSVTLFLV